MPSEQAQIGLAPLSRPNPAQDAPALYSSPPPQPLAIEKQTAIEALVSGESISGAARIAQVNRATIYRWLKSDSDFIAAFNRWKEESQASAHGKLISLLDKAAKTVERSLDAGDAKTAMQLLHHFGALDRRSLESTDENEIALKLRQDEHFHQKEIKQLQNHVDRQTAAKPVDFDRIDQLLHRAMIECDTAATPKKRKS